MTAHRIISVKKHGRHHTIECECGAVFGSIESEALARSYHQRHIMAQTKKAMSS